jgi:hypothetical protein
MELAPVMDRPEIFIPHIPKDIGKIKIIIRNIWLRA